MRHVPKRIQRRRVKGYRMPPNAVWLAVLVARQLCKEPKND